MTRAVPEWVGRSDDSPIPDRVKLRVFLRHNGICQCGCGRKIVAERWECDHRVALVNGGNNSEANLVPLLAEHHKTKTHADVTEKSITYRKRKAHYGIKQSRNPMPGSKASKWKKTVSGQVVLRQPSYKR